MLQEKSRASGNLVSDVLLLMVSGGVAESFLPIPLKSQAGEKPVQERDLIEFSRGTSLGIFPQFMPHYRACQGQFNNPRTNFPCQDCNHAVLCQW